MKKVMNVFFGLVGIIGFVLILGCAGSLDTDNSLRIMDILPQMLIGVRCMFAVFMKKVME